MMEFCYIGLDMDGHKLVRPVLRQGSCRWLAKDKDLCIGEKHLFGIINPQPEGMYPHRTNDVLVNYINPCDPSEDNSDLGELYDILIDQSRQTVKEVFGNMDGFKREIRITVITAYKVPVCWNIQMPKEELNNRRRTGETEM
ncbi:hypothetical protein OS493_022448 [Desmophyllum pertusum]|uniref:Uncharacterized protein n=1 Tax=Desmophyllum pertusum TaxID=174260 RepID=A0A9W9ZMC8_9CNID|nr:hypothetical protein OS493_022448 [Desmophyllum pertusum]